MNRPKAATRRAALAAFLLFAAALLVVSPAEASRTTTDARSSLAPSSLELPILEPLDSAESSPRFGFAEDLGLLDPERGPGGFVVFAAEAAQCELTYAGNNPLRYVDPDGRVKFEAGAQAYYAMASAYLNQSPTARAQLQAFEGLKGQAEPTIRIVEDGSDEAYVDPRTNTIVWNPWLGASVQGEGGTPGADGSWEQSPALRLLHEIGHSVRMNTDPSGYAADTTYPKGYDFRYDNKEEKRVITKIETPAARQLGEATRRSHSLRSTTSMSVTPLKKATKPTDCGGTGQSPCVRKVP